MSDKETTIDDLARMVAEGFNGIQESLDKQFREVRHEMGKCVNMLIYVLSP